MEDLDDYRWLIGRDAAEWLARLRGVGPESPALVAGLRRELSAGRTRLLLEQVALRQRAAAKFSQADRMFFTPLGLEQATDEWVAACKAARFPAGEPCADLCCGIGGDLLALAARGAVTGVDRQPVAALLAEANAAALGLSAPRDGAPAARIEVCDVTDFDLTGYSAWHIDPDRRPAGRRTIRVADHEPDESALARLLERSPHACLKLAPAAEIPAEWAPRAEWEWVSRGGECRQLTGWFGRLATAPGQRRATVLGRDGSARSVAGTARPLEDYSPPREYLLEPDAAVLAAGLTAELAAEHGLAGIARGVGYLTGDRPVNDPALACFRVTDVLPLRIKKLQGLLASRGIGRLEIKKRGVACDPADLRRQLAVRGDREATLLIAPLGRTVTAFLAQRVDSTVTG